LKHDIEDRKDIILLVDSFYKKVNNNYLLSPVFNTVAKVNWETHLSKMYSFWASVLLGEASYNGDTMTIHTMISKQHQFTQVMFENWLMMFTETIDQLFEGTKANEAKTRAKNIAGLIQSKTNAT
jgi:hemoglobin|tara:strand:- start:4429 stop:4803 length:375 start_codon:yes stop_codon:yes gene_type:complete